MFCKNCRAQLDDDAPFCNHCGTVIKRIVSESTPQDMKVSDSTEISVSTESVQNNNIHELQRENNQKKLIIGAVVAAFVLVIGLLLSGVLGNSSNGNASNIHHETNFNNGARFAYDNNCLYIVGRYNEDTEDTVLYSTDYNGTNKRIISDNSNINRIRLVGEKIYFGTSNDDTHTIGVMKKDGSEIKTIISSSEFIKHYDIHKDTLYYLEDSAIHSISIDGKNDTVILKSTKSFTLCNGYIYYVNKDDVISSYRISNGQVKELCKSSNVAWLSVDDNTLYFYCDTGLSSTKINGDGKITKILMDKFGKYVFYEGQIYYIRVLTLDEIKTIVEYLPISSSEKAAYTLALVGSGILYKADFSGGEVEHINSNPGFACSLYSYPDGLYCQSSVLSDFIEPIELN